jgi:hypothetical protein
MFNRYSLGATVLAVFLLAIFGINRAFSWLRASPGNDTAADRGASVEDNRTIDSADNGFIESGRPAGSQNGNQSGDLPNGALSDDVFAPTALETAGTYIQRQQGAEFDQLIADSSVESTSAPDGALPTQNDNQTDSPAETDDVDTSSTAPVSQPVPALW